MSLEIPDIKAGDWTSVRIAFQKLKSLRLGPDSSPTFYGLTLTTPLLVPSGGTGLATLTDHGLLLGSGTGAITPLAAAAHGQLPIGSTGADPVLATLTGTANQVNVANAAGSITLSTPQDIHAAATPTFAGLTVVNAITEFSTDGTLGGNSDSAVPTEKATKTYVDLAIGASKDFFLSDNDDAVIADYHILYQTDTGEAGSTLVTGTMGIADDQLMFSYITASGVPGVTFLRAGIYVLHTHLAVTTGNRTTKFYWTLSKRILAGTETVLMTSEESSAIPGAMASFITHATLTSDATILTTDRLVLKLHANVTGGGADTVVTIYMEGTNDCHLTNLLPSSIWQSQGDVLDDLNTLGVNAADSEFLVGTAAGALAWESGATLRTSIGVGTGDSPTFAGLSLGTGELTCGSINRASGTLTVEIGGTAELSITATATTFGGNLIIPDSGTIGSASDTNVMTIDASGNCTFSVFPITPSAAPDADYEVANKKYVDDNAGGGANPTSAISVYISADQLIDDETLTTVAFNTEDYDLDNEFNTTTHIFTCKTAGYYAVTFFVTFDVALAGALINAYVVLNGAAVAQMNAVQVHNTYWQTIFAHKDLYLAVDDEVKFQVYQDSDGNYNIKGGAPGQKTFVTIHKISG